MPTTCLEHNFSSYAELAERDLTFLRRFGEHTVTYPIGTDVFEQGTPANHLYVLASGWCFVKYDERDGGRQVLDICHGGDIVGSREVCFQRSICGLETLSTVELCAFPKAYLTEMFVEHPRLSAILFLASMRREALLVERVVNLGRRTAFARLCHFLVEMNQRGDRANPKRTDKFSIPIPASLLSDVLGLSEVHTYRMLKQLNRDGFASFDNGRFIVHNMAALAEVCGFSEDYLHLDRSWIPAA